MLSQASASNPLALNHMGTARQKLHLSGRVRGGETPALESGNVQGASQLDAGHRLVIIFAGLMLSGAARCAA